LELYDVQGESRVGWGCVAVSCGGVVLSVSSSSMVAVGFSIVIGSVVVIVVLSSCIISVGVVIGRVGSSMGQGDVLSIVRGVQQAGGSLHDGVTTI